MLYNIVENKEIKSIFAIPETEGGLSDLAFENGWRISAHAVTGKYVVRYLQNRDYETIADIPQVVLESGTCLTFLTADQWNELINTMYNDEETLLLCDSPNYTPYVEDVADEPEDEYSEWFQLDEPETNDADTQCEVPHDYVEEFHALNKQ